MPNHNPPIKCTPCRVTIDGKRWRIYSDGSVSIALTYAEVQRLNFINVKEVLDYESKLPRLLPHSLEAKTIRREASRLRRNRTTRERNQAMRDMGMTKTPYGWE